MAAGDKATLLPTGIYLLGGRNQWTRLGDLPEADTALAMLTTYLTPSVCTLSFRFLTGVLDQNAGVNSYYFHCLQNGAVYSVVTSREVASGRTERPDDGSYYQGAAQPTTADDRSGK